jgi:hypothetical protein
VPEQRAMNRPCVTRRPGHAAAAAVASSCCVTD